MCDIRWDNKPECVYCGHNHCYTINVRSIGTRYKCKSCKKQFGPKVGTIFENSGLPLSLWFRALEIYNDEDHGISTYKLAKQLGITQKSAWYVKKRIVESEGHFF